MFQDACSLPPVSCELPTDRESQTSDPFMFKDEVINTSGSSMWDSSSTIDFVREGSQNLENGVQSDDASTVYDADNSVSEYNPTTDEEASEGCLSDDSVPCSDGENLPAPVFESDNEDALSSGIYDLIQKFDLPEVDTADTAELPILSDVSSPGNSPLGCSGTPVPKKTKCGSFSRNVHKDGRKKHCCLFCGKWVYRMPRHICSKHEGRSEVAELLQLPRQERNARLSVLVRKGDFEANMQSVRNSSEFLLLLEEAVQTKPL